jgi:hypothetical protein
MPAVPSSLLEPIWVEFAAAVGTEERPEFDPSHPPGCHRRRIWERVVFEHLLDALVHGSGYERIATAACSDRTIRRRLAEWLRPVSRSGCMLWPWPATTESSAWTWPMSTHPASPHPLPLARPANHTPTQVIPTAGRSTGDAVRR